MPRRIRLHAIGAVAASAIVVLGSASPVAAKFPYFSVQLEPEAPRAGETVTVTVRTWADATHRRPSGFTHEGALTDLLEFQRVGDGVPALVPVSLEMVERDLLRAWVPLPSGEWRLVAFPHGRGAGSDFGPGYPDPMTLVVREDEARFAGPPLPCWAQPPPPLSWRSRCDPGGGNAARRDRVAPENRAVGATQAVPLVDRAERAPRRDGTEAGWGGVSDPVDARGGWHPR